STNSVALKFDNIAPTISHTLSPKPNADDWNKANVTVTFTAKDDDKGSGVASVTAPVTVSTETAGQVVNGTAKDTAGNIGTDSVTVKLDKTAPAISGTITAGTKTPSGWYNGPVTVSFTCSDALSGVATCPDPVILSANGANTATGTVTDKAGNTATAQVGSINIDQEKPTLTTADVSVQGGVFPVGSVPAATCTATDSFSGVASCTVTVTGGNAKGVGTFTYTATAVDRAGNTTTISGTYRVVYKFSGFLQPINDTAHQVGASTSIFKAGSTVPVKFQLRNASGALMQAATAPVWMTPVKGSAMSVPVDETVYSPAGDSGTAFRYDATAQQYIYNWKTGSTGGNYWRIGVTLDDGQTYYTNIGLR
ncbi:MAG TPA: PxKF domain-containing protein, partial [Glaciibacter sp.]|nr:PxKF domain-containing protein [Glaciibacter sp.]